MKEEDAVPDFLDFVLWLLFSLSSIFIFISSYKDTSFFLIFAVFF
jgi:hypothetical protein